MSDSHKATKGGMSASQNAAKGAMGDAPNGAWRVIATSVGAEIPTPALLIDTDRVDHNIAAVVRQCGTPDRWRPHVKTAKVPEVMAQFLAHGVARFKCATTRELRTLLELGAPDVLLSFPVVGATAARVVALSRDYPRSRVSVLVEGEEHLAAFAGSATGSASASGEDGGGLGVFIDCNSGMDRTGRDAADIAALGALIEQVNAVGCVFRGLHWYDGHVSAADLADRTRTAHAGYDRLLGIVAALRGRGIIVPEIVVAGTPAAPCALSYARWNETGAEVQVSPGTVVYNDTTSLSQMPAEWDLQPAAFVLASVVSHPRTGRFTCDAGHKSVSADAGIPTCTVIGHEDWTPTKPSEEHLPIDVSPGRSLPAIGAQVLLLPRHVCPTVNNFDEALLVRGGRVERAVKIEARGHAGIAE